MRKLWLFVLYINTKDNVEADEESRKTNPGIEWELSESAFNHIVSRLVNPEVNLFASRINAKCPEYVSWKPDPDAISVDAFPISWHKNYFTLFHLSLLF